MGWQISWGGLFGQNFLPTFLGGKIFNVTLIVALYPTSPRAISDGNEGGLVRPAGWRRGAIETSKKNLLTTLNYRSI